MPKWLKTSLTNIPEILSQYSKLPDVLPPLNFWRICWAKGGFLLVDVSGCGCWYSCGSSLSMCMLNMSVLCVCTCVFLNTNKLNCKCNFWNRIELFCVCTYRYLHGSLNFIFQVFWGMNLVSISGTFPIPFKWLRPFPHFLCLWRPFTHPSPHPSPIVCIGTTFISTSSIYFSLVPTLPIPCFSLYTYSCL